MSYVARPRVAFVGSGGGAKGIAHLGVLRAMQELDVLADVFVGTSTGAVFGAFHAQGWPIDRMVDWLRPFYARREPETALKARTLFGLPTAAQLATPGWLTSGVLSIDPLERFLRRTLPSNDFRKIDGTLLVTSSDVDGRGRVVFGRGYEERVPISEAVAASCCIPVLYRPYRIGDRYFVDGELVRTLSVDLAVEAGAEVVVISSVYRPHVTKTSERSLAHGGPFAVGRQMLNVVLAEKEKRGIDLIHRTHPHVTILNVSPDLGRLPFMTRGPARRLLTSGYREGLRVLAAAKERGVFSVRSNVRTVGNA